MTGLAVVVSQADPEGVVVGAGGGGGERAGAGGRGGVRVPADAGRADGAARHQILLRSYQDRAQSGNIIHPHYLISYRYHTL